MSGVAPVPRYRVLKRTIRMRVAGEVFVMTPGLLEPTDGVRVERLKRTARDHVSRQ